MIMAAPIHHRDVRQRTNRDILCEPSCSRHGRCPRCEEHAPDRWRPATTQYALPLPIGQADSSHAPAFGNVTRASDSLVETITVTRPLIGCVRLVSRRAIVGRCRSERHRYGGERLHRRLRRRSGGATATTTEQVEAVDFPGPDDDLRLADLRLLLRVIDRGGLAPATELWDPVNQRRPTAPAVRRQIRCRGDRLRRGRLLPGRVDTRSRRGSRSMNGSTSTSRPRLRCPSQPASGDHHRWAAGQDRGVSEPDRGNRRRRRAALSLHPVAQPQ